LYENEKEVTAKIIQYKDVCGKCGAKRVDKQLGLEPTPELYTQHLLEGYTEVKRVLRDDGTFWMNAGDCHAGSGKAGKNPEYWKKHTEFGKIGNKEHFGIPMKIPNGLKQKDLVGIPWRIAFALQGFAVVPFHSFSIWADELKLAREKQDWECVQIVEGKLRQMDLLSKLQTSGWYLRLDIIWSKGNVMPESCTDRPTKSHEYIFLLTKQPHYYYDIEAIREPQNPESVKRYEYNFWGDGTKETSGGGRPDGASNTAGKKEFNLLGRNKRSVWNINPIGYPGAHFATFPPSIPEIAIKAGTSERGCCPICGTPWKRIIERERVATRPGTNTKIDDTSEETHGNRDPERHCTTTKTIGWEPGCDCKDEKAIAEWKKQCGADKNGEYHGHATKDFESAGVQNASEVKARILEGMGVKKMVGWEPNCEYGAYDPIPCTILDPFGGSGTTAAVASQLGRYYDIIELNPEYVKLIKERIKSRQTNLLNLFNKLAITKDIIKEEMNKNEDQNI
jgi:hypothetical protein